MEDCINLENGQSLQERRLKKEIEYAYIKEKFFPDLWYKTLKKSGEDAIQSYQKIFNNINEFVKKQRFFWKKILGKQMNFYILG